MEMDALASTSEIVESSEEVNSELKKYEKNGKCSTKSVNTYSIEDDINRLFEAIDVKSSVRGVYLSHEDGKGALWKKAMKRPMRVGSPQASGIGISEPASLKQAFRGLCISQASEMAAIKRVSRPTVSSVASDAGTIRKLYRAVVVEANESGVPLNEGHRKLVEISLVPESSKFSQMANTEDQDKASHSRQDQTVVMDDETSNAERQSVQTSNLSSISSTNKQPQEMDDNCSMVSKISCDRPTSKGQQHHLQAESAISTSTPCSTLASSAHNSPCFIRPLFRSRNTDKKKLRHGLVSSSRSSRPSSKRVTDDLQLSDSTSDGRFHACTPESATKDDVTNSPASSSANYRTGIKDSSSCKPVSGFGSGNTSLSKLTKVDETSRSREKGEFSQSSKSSIGEYSSSTSISEDSSLSASSRSGNRPHMSKDLRWEAINHIQKQHGSLSLKHFKLIKKLGCGDIGSVYLAELTGTGCLFALKVMDNEFLASRKKTSRAQTEREILQMLDHPFLPTLYAHFVSEKLSCLVMEYCPGGDLHVLRQKQPGRSFPEQAARFYVAEVLLALEYLHMLGVVYRDLKPENILVREDGHIMLTDFDLSLRCAVNPIIIQSSSPNIEQPKKTSSPCSQSSCIEPFCLHPDWQVSCFTPRLLSVTGRSRRLKSDLANQFSPLPQLVVEPTGARSNSFVGTHEYLAPEIIKGEGHGNAVDWWTFGIFLFELIYGRTPFKGSGNEETLSNVVSRTLKFPNYPVVSFNARDLIRGLLIKEPENRLGSAKGAAEIKQHPFFEGLNWALVRCAVPPELPKSFDAGTCSPTVLQNKESPRRKESKTSAEFEMF